MSTLIFQTFHKEFIHNPACDWVKPIGVNGFYGPEFLGDNTGCNISHLNDFYCELTAQYWAWKNLDVEHIGFYHYRRYLSFLAINGYHENKTVNSEDAAAAVAFLTSDQQKNALDDMLSITDVITAQGTHLPPSVQAQYCNVVENNPWNLFVHHVKKKYPNSVDPSVYFNVVSVAPICNMYVMKKHVFHHYCEDLFSIIDSVFDQIGSPYDSYNNRYPGFLAERFLGYWLHIQRVSRIEVPMIVLK